ncbi:MAG: GNAT family N-acetyltransferase [Acidimicrobiales bacterium]
MESPGAIELRPPRPEDRSAIIGLLASALGRDDDPRFEALYAWKHEDNPFGPSVKVVAVDGAEIVGFRGLMRWRWRHGHRVIEAVRAVDTATHPDHQGRGIFTRLTQHALETLAAEGVGFVFNTPNSQSLPGYLKMGWQVVGRVPISVRFRSPRAAVRMVRARTPAQRWSERSDAGEAAGEVLDDTGALTDLLDSQPSSSGLRTVRSASYLAWRYSIDALGYRALVADGGPSEGLIVFRIRRRGPAREVVLAELLVPGADPRRARALHRRLAAAVEADYILRAGHRPMEGYLPLPRQGPILTWRAVCDARMPPRAEWGLTMGDVELF